MSDYQREVWLYIRNNKHRCRGRMVWQSTSVLGSPGSGTYDVGRNKAKKALRIGARKTWRRPK